MSLHIGLRIDSDRIGGVTVSRLVDDHGSDHDAVNSYEWQQMRAGRLLASGIVSHRFGGGAVALAAKVLSAVAERQAAMGGKAS